MAADGVSYPAFLHSGDPLECGVVGRGGQEPVSAAASRSSLQVRKDAVAPRRRRSCESDVTSQRDTSGAEQRERERESVTAVVAWETSLWLGRPRIWGKVQGQAHRNLDDAGQ